MGNSKFQIWHVGNWCIHVGQKYIESPFLSPSKDVEIHNYGQPFVDAVKTIPNSIVESSASWDLYHMSPEAFDEKLKWATHIVFGDVETKCLMLHPDFFNREKWGDEPITFPDRFDILKNWVEKGGHFLMLGGWYSFSGERGKGGWGRSRFHDVLPVECMPYDDLIESTDGYTLRTPNPNHPAINGIDWNTAPPLLGFNETKLKKGSQMIVEIENQGKWFPLCASKKYGQGRSSAWMTSATPHWGINFMKWKQYNQFWRQLLLTD